MEESVTLGTDDNSSGTQLIPRNYAAQSSPRAPKEINVKVPGKQTSGMDTQHTGSIFLMQKMESQPDCPILVEGNARAGGDRSNTAASTNKRRIINISEIAARVTKESQFKTQKTNQPTRLQSLKSEIHSQSNYKQTETSNQADEKDFPPVETTANTPEERPKSRNPANLFEIAPLNVQTFQMQLPICDVIAQHQAGAGLDVSSLLSQSLVLPPRTSTSLIYRIPAPSR